MNITMRFGTYDISLYLCEMKNGLCFADYLIKQGILCKKGRKCVGVFSLSQFYEYGRLHGTIKIVSNKAFMRRIHGTDGYYMSKNDVKGFFATVDCIMKDLETVRIHLNVKQ
jgi:hypothetical protein